MAAKWVEQGWVSVRDLAYLGWSESSIDNLKRAVPEEDSGLPGLGKGRDLAAVNDWARDNGEPIVSSKALNAPKERSAPVSNRKPKGSHPKSKINSKPNSKARTKRNPPPPQLPWPTASTPGSVPFPSAGSWFPSKRQANAAGYLSAKDLAGRLWTEGLISDILDEPQAHGENFHNSSAPIRYWETALVLACEASPGFDDRMARSLKRRKIGWEQSILAISSSNRELGISSGQMILAWANRLGDLLDQERPSPSL